MRVPDESLAPLLPAAEAKLTSSTLGKRIILGIRELIFKLTERVERARGSERAGELRRAPPEVGLREEGRRPR